MPEQSSRVIAKFLRFLYAGKVNTIEDMAEARDLNQLAEEHGLNHLRVECEVAIARGFSQPSCAVSDSSAGALSDSKPDTADGGDRGSFSESFEVVDATDSLEVPEGGAHSPSPFLQPNPFDEEARELPSSGSSGGGGGGLDDDAELLRDATNAAARQLVREDLTAYLEANPGPRGSFVGWIASLHPENVHLDSRMWIEGNDWLEAWREAKGEHPKGMKATTVTGVASAGQILATDAGAGLEHPESSEVAQNANFATEWPANIEVASGDGPAGSHGDGGANDDDCSDDEGEALLLRSSTHSASGAGGTGDKAKSTPGTLESFFRGWGRNSLNSNDKAATAAAAAAAAATEGVEAEDEDDSTATATKEAHFGGAKNTHGAAGGVSDSSSGEEDDDDDDGGHLDPRVERALSAYTSAVAEHNTLTAAAHACSDREVERR